MTTTAPDRQPATPGQALRWAAARWRRQAVGVNEWDTAAALCRWADELDAAPTSDPDDALNQLAEAASRFGVALDPEDVAQLVADARATRLSLAAPATGRAHRRRWRQPPRMADPTCQVPDEHDRPVCVRTWDQLPCATCPMAPEREVSGDAK